MRYLLARRGDALAGAVPVSVERRWGLAWARSLPFGTYGGPLVSASESDPSLVRAILARSLNEWLGAERVAGGEIVTAAEEPDPAWSGLASAVGRGTTHVVDLSPGFDSLLAGLHRETRRGLRVAEREGVVAAEERGALAEAHALYLGQARAWAGHRPYPEAFLRALLDHPSRFARLYSARRGDKLLCAILALAAGGETFIWWSGSAPSSRSTLAYPFLMLDIVRRAAEAGERRVNVGGSGGLDRLQRFKESLGATPLAVWTYHLAPRAGGLRMKLLAWARAMGGRR